MTIERHLGEKIRQLREEQQLSIEALATQSQLSEAFLSQVESGQSLPSLAPLMKISRALGVRLGTFLDEEAYSGPIIVRNGNADEVVRFSGAEASGNNTLDFYSLASHKKIGTWNLSSLPCSREHNIPPIFLLTKEKNSFMYSKAPSRFLMGKTPTY